MDLNRNFAAGRLRSRHDHRVHDDLRILGLLDGAEDLRLHPRPGRSEPNAACRCSGTFPFSGKSYDRSRALSARGGRLEVPLQRSKSLPGHVKVGHINYLAPIIALGARSDDDGRPSFRKVCRSEMASCSRLCWRISTSEFFSFWRSRPLGVYGNRPRPVGASNSKYPFPRCHPFLRADDLLRAGDGPFDPAGFHVGRPHRGTTPGYPSSAWCSPQQALWLVLWQPLSALIFLVAIFAETKPASLRHGGVRDRPRGRLSIPNTGLSSSDCSLSRNTPTSSWARPSSCCLFLGGWNFLPGLADPWPAPAFGAVLSVLWFMAKVFFMIFFLHLDTVDAAALPAMIR